MEEKIRKWKKKKWLIAVPLLIAATAVYMLCFASDDNAVVVSEGGAGGRASDSAGGAGASGDDLSGGADGSEGSAAGGGEDVSIYVDIGGAVKEPQVVVLSEGARIYEAVEAAGGLEADAEIKYMNMAAVCEDGAKIYVPTKQELADAAAGNENTADAQLFASAGSGDASNGISAGQAYSGSSGDQGKVNINTADSAALQTLTGIGPSMAQRIIDYRNANGKFSSPDELQNVSGIGEKTLSKIIGSICV
ncbi:MAG: helix-hairpin-helix domain-containing protein [Firmicutes bacterium]|nr:helix-hairpin-helix domain-containing protein [Bacillota bacterium]